MKSAEASLDLHPAADKVLKYQIAVSSTLELAKDLNLITEDLLICI